MVTLYQDLLATRATLFDLACVDYTVQPYVLVREIFASLEAHSDYPGVMIQDGARFIGMISRNHLFEHLSRPFGSEVFLNRPIASFMKQLNSQNIILPAEMAVDEAVQFVLSRPAGNLYEPLVVRQSDGTHRLLDMQVLLLAQSRLLSNTNRFIEKQAELGRLLANTLELNEVTRLILAGLSELAPFDRALILLTKNTGADEVVTSNFASTHIDQTQDPALHPEVRDHLVRQRAPLVISSTKPLPFQLGRLSFPEVNSWIGYPLFQADQLLGILSLSRTGESVMDDYQLTDLDRLSSLEGTFTTAIRNAQLVSEMQFLAKTDPLTCVNNRRGFMDLAQTQVEFAVHNGKNALCALMIDIDHFKRVNDAYGHRLGDYVIKNVVAECSAHLRSTDLMGRYGGEEFVALLPDIDLEAARHTAERLRFRIAQKKIDTPRGQISVTVSIGVAQLDVECVNLDMLLQHADEALYLAKKYGRNRVELWNPKMTPTSIHPSVSLPAPDPLPAINISAPMLESEIELRAEAYDETILGWVKALELRDKETEGHAQRVADITVALARKVGVPEEAMIHIYRGALLHDIGKIAIPDQILFKPGNLTAEEWEVMRKHPEYAYQVLWPIQYLRPALSIPYAHHERWDGSGYPRQLKGQEIPLEARIFAIVDVWDALNSDRCYRPAWSASEIYQYLLNQSGKHFDPDLVPVFIETVIAEPARFFTNKLLSSSTLVP